MNPQEIQPQEQDIPSDPVSLAKQIQSIEKDMKTGISVIQEVLSILVSKKLSLDKIKAMTKDNLKDMSNEIHK